MRKEVIEFMTGMIISFAIGSVLVYVLIEAVTYILMLLGIKIFRKIKKVSINTFSVDRFFLDIIIISLIRVCAVLMLVLLTNIINYIFFYKASVDDNFYILVSDFFYNTFLIWLPLLIIASVTSTFKLAMSHVMGKPQKVKEIILMISSLVVGFVAMMVGYTIFHIG